MNENAAASPELTLSQLVTGIGKLVLDISKQTGQMSSRLETLEEALVRGLPGRLDRLAAIDSTLTEMLAVLRERPPAAAPAAEPLEAAPSQVDLAPLTGHMEGAVRRLEALEERLAAIHAQVEAVAGSTARTAQAAESAAEAARTAPADPVTGEPGPAVQAQVDLAPLLAPVESGVARLASVEERLAAMEAVLSGTRDMVDERLASLSQAVSGQEALDRVIVPMEAGFEKLSGSISAVSGPVEAGMGRMEAVESAVASLPGHLDAIGEKTGAIMEAVLQLGQIGMETSTAVKELGPGLSAGLSSVREAATGGTESVMAALDEQARTVEAFRMSVDERFEGIVKASSEEFGTVRAALEGQGGLIAGFQGEIDARVDTFSKATSEELARIESVVGDQRSLIDDMRITLGETSQGQERTLAEMTGLLTVHRDQLLRSRVEDLNNEAIHLFNDGRPDEAVALLREAVSIDPGRSELWANLGHLLAASGETGESEASFRKALEIDPALEPALSGLGILLVRAGRPKETLEFLSRFLADTAPSARVAIACARALAATGRHVDAMNLLRRAQTADPANPDLETELAGYREKA
jgi:Flp pilus assembly protein TadD